MSKWESANKADLACGEYLPEIDQPLYDKFEPLWLAIEVPVREVMGPVWDVYHV